MLWLTHLSRLYRCAPEHVRPLSSRESENVQASQSAELGPFPKPTGSASHLGTGVFQYHDLVPPTTMSPNQNATSPSENQPSLNPDHSNPTITQTDNSPILPSNNTTPAMPLLSDPQQADTTTQPDAEPDAASTHASPEMSPNSGEQTVPIEPNPIEVPVPETESSGSEDSLMSDSVSPQLETGDHWIIQGRQLIRVHKTPRVRPFFPTSCANCPVPCEWLSDDRQTHVMTEQGYSWKHEDVWRNNIQAHLPLPTLWTGKTIFTILKQHINECPTQEQYIALCHEQTSKGYEMEILLSVDEIQHCTEQTYGDQIAFLASSAKKQRSEVREKDLSPSDKLLFQNAKSKEISSWLSTETVRRIARSQIPAEQILRSRWVLTWKPLEPNPTDPSAATHKPKARLVILGYEDPQLDEMARDSPTMGRDARVLIMQYAASARWRLRSFDIQTAFLRGSRKDGRVLGMEPPAEMRTMMKLEPWECCELLKSAYGLCNAPLLWYEELKNALVSLGFVMSPLDPCTFVLPKKGQSGIHGLVGIHVDDGLGAGDDTFNRAIQQLEARYPFGSKLQDDFTFTGIHIHQNWDGSIELDQQKYIEDIPPINIDRSRRTTPEELITEKERQALRGLVGSIQYAATNTRPDLSAKLSFLQAKINSAQVKDLLDGNRLLTEAKQHKGTKIVIQSIPIQDLRFVSFSDASFATRANSQSQKGCLILAASKEIGEWQSSQVSPLMWYSRKIARVVGSTLASETYALSGSVDLLSWLRVQWSWLCQPSDLWKDPDKCLSMCPESYAIVDCKSLYDLIQKTTVPQCQEYRTTLEALIIKDRLRNGIVIKWVHSAAQLADCLTTTMDCTPLRRFLHEGRCIIHDIDEVLRARADKRTKQMWMNQIAKTAHTVT